MEKKNGYLVISLDFELLWGAFDKVDYRNKRMYFENTRNVIPKILRLFSEYNIHCTWAAVGMLFNGNWKDWEQNKPERLPNYKNKALSAYNYANLIKNKIDTEIYVFAKDLVQLVQNSPFQEIGTHTYSHYYCREAGQNIEAFKEDLKKALELAQNSGVDLNSLVFPRNQLNKDYLEVCYGMGITSVRSNPSSWYWEDTLSESFAVKLSRSGDAYLPLGKKSYPLNDLVKKKGRPLEQKASRFLRPVEGNSFLRKLKLIRIKREMTWAAKRNEIYHLWWHPHNFGAQPEESLKDLTLLLKHFVQCREEYGFESLNMQEINKVFNSTE